MLNSKILKNRELGCSKWSRCKASGEWIPRRSGTYAAGRLRELNAADRPFSAADPRILRGECQRDRLRHRHRPAFVQRAADLVVAQRLARRLLDLLERTLLDGTRRKRR